MFFYVEKVTRWTSCYSDVTKCLLMTFLVLFLSLLQAQDLRHYSNLQTFWEWKYKNSAMMLTAEELQEEVTVIVFSFFFFLTDRKIITSDELCLTGRHVYICCCFASLRIGASPPPAQDVKGVWCVLRQMICSNNNICCMWPRHLLSAVTSSFPMNRFTSAENTRCRSLFNALQN